MQRIVGEINIKDDLVGFDAAPEKPRDQGLDSSRNMGYLVIRVSQSMRHDALICCEIAGLDGVQKRFGKKTALGASMRYLMTLALLKAGAVIAQPTVTSTRMEGAQSMCRDFLERDTLEPRAG